MRDVLYPRRGHLPNSPTFRYEEDAGVEETLTTGGLVPTSLVVRLCSTILVDGTISIGETGCMSFGLALSSDPREKWRKQSQWLLVLA